MFKLDIELEISDGLLKLSQKEAEERTLVFYRTIKDKEESQDIEDLESLMDSYTTVKSEKVIEPECKKLFDELNEKIKNKLPASNIINCETTWDDESEPASNRANQIYLENVGKRFEEKIIGLFNKMFKVNSHSQRHAFYENMVEWKKAVYEDHIENVLIRKRFADTFEFRDDTVVEKVSES